ncbi:MAG: dihydroorotase [Dehalococcoidales bacterium]|nr:dihydroorotase [Dehalococcoidales bacterium]
MNKTMLIKNGRIIDPSQDMDMTGDLLITDGRIKEVAASIKEIPADCNVLDAKGMIVCPGFIDFHCHLRQPGFEEKETIATGSKAAAKGGFTTICCMPNTNPALDNRATIDYIKSASATDACIRVLPIGCITKGRAGKELADMGELAEAGVVAVSDDGSTIADSRIMKQALEYSTIFGLLVGDHCEDVMLSNGGQINEGIIATRLGLRGIPNAAEENIIARDIALAKLTGARIHICHISTHGSVELVRNAKKDGVKITVEVTPHHLTMDEGMVLGFDTNAKVNPPLRTRKDIAALIAGLKDDTIDIIATDHAPHTDNEKLCEFAIAPFGISGFETALGSLMKLVHNGDIEIGLLLSKLTAAPAKIIGSKFGKLGTLEQGAMADITIFDPDAEWKVNVEEFYSRGRNTPLNGEKLKGKVMATIFNGKVVYKDNSVKLGVKA